VTGEVLTTGRKGFVRLSRARRTIGRGSGERPSWSDEGARANVTSKVLWAAGVRLCVSPRASLSLKPKKKDAGQAYFSPGANPIVTGLLQLGVLSRVRP